jgi:hypothetical protein
MLAYNFDQSHQLLVVDSSTTGAKRACLYVSRVYVRATRVSHGKRYHVRAELSPPSLLRFTHEARAFSGVEGDCRHVQSCGRRESLPLISPDSVPCRPALQCRLTLNCRTQYMYEGSIRERRKSMGNFKIESGRGYRGLLQEEEISTVGGWKH